MGVAFGDLETLAESDTGFSCFGRGGTRCEVIDGSKKSQELSLFQRWIP